jgi:hypothetical protein
MFHAQFRLVLVGVLSLATSASAADSPRVTERDRQHYAFRKLPRPTVPHGKDNSRVRTPIDAFVLARLEANGLTFSPEADRRTLNRRVSLDLLGLPPAPEDVEAFVNDPRPDAYERLIDRLLASPHFGERWGRHWLDGAGYVDVTGGDNDAATIKLGENKWRYRDYVIAAFNDDLPFERFLVEQIAGDELVDWRSQKTFDPATRRLLIATGFLRTAADDTDENELNTLDIRHGILQRTGEVLASNLLGLTLQCAKCHDHKYEPISQQDYYRLLALLQPAFNPANWLQPKQRLIKDAVWGNLQVVCDSGPPTPTYLLRRGNHDRPGAEVTPGFLSVLCDSEPAAILGPTKAEGKTSGRRLALARWLTDFCTPAGGLVLRVHVNRVWAHLFGKGLVETCDNLGVTGAKPTHPELLEWLASQFAANEGRLKPLLKLLLTSTVYRQGSADVLPNGTSVDPEDRLLWRQRLRRLESEVVRDSILAVSGQLDRSSGGAPVPVEARPDGSFVLSDKGLPTPSSRWRRSVYLLARRNYHPTLLNVFDQPNLTTNCPCRTPSAVVLQSLTMLNDGVVLEQADFLAARVARSAANTEGRIDAAFRIVLARPPRPRETEWCADLLRRHAERYQAQKLSTDQAAQKALGHLCHTLLNTSEFLYAP